MTAIITETIIRAIRGANYSVLSTTFGVTAIALLLVLLISKELLRSQGDPRREAAMRALDIAILPLLLAFGAIMVMRFVILLRLA
jgi:hypothetical protein